MGDPPIPADLEARLVLLRPILEQNGCVQLHAEKNRRPVWRLRYRAVDAGLAGRRHKSVRLGGEAIAGAVRRLIEGWREPLRSAREELRHREARERERRRQFRRDRRQLQTASGGGPRRRRAVGREFDRALAKGTLELWALAMSVRNVAPAGKLGRPRKGRLCVAH